MYLAAKELELCDKYRALDVNIYLMSCDVEL
jgi:hypothetical protein